MKIIPAREDQVSTCKEVRGNGTKLDTVRRGSPLQANRLWQKACSVLPVCSSYTGKNRKQSLLSPFNRGLPLCHHKNPLPTKRSRVPCPASLTGALKRTSERSCSWEGRRRGKVANFWRASECSCPLGFWPPARNQPGHPQGASEQASVQEKRDERKPPANWSRWCSRGCSQRLSHLLARTRGEGVLGRATSGWQRAAARASRASGPGQVGGLCRQRYPVQQEQSGDWAGRHPLSTGPELPAAVMASLRSEPLN